RLAVAALQPVLPLDAALPGTARRARHRAARRPRRPAERAPDRALPAALPALDRAVHEGVGRRPSRPALRVGEDRARGGCGAGMTGEGRRALARAVALLVLATAGFFLLEEPMRELEAA